MRIQEHGQVSFDDLFSLIKKSIKDLNNFSGNISQQPIEELLLNLKSTMENIGSKVSKRPPPLEKYMQQWSEFISKRRDDLDKGTVRFLCWEPSVATNQYFLDYLLNSEIDLSKRSLEGLVRSCHQKWDDPFPESPILAKVRSLIRQYDGSSPVLVKWKRNLEVILSPKAHELISSDIIQQNKTVHACVDEWYLEAITPFVHKFVKSAINKCREKIGSSNWAGPLLFNELLQWPGWGTWLTDFKQKIGELILHPLVATSNIQENLLHFILTHKDLGHPLLPANRGKWMGVNPNSRNRVLEWLSTLDISFFFDRVFPPGTDRQHRKEFWLRYVGRCTATRPILRKDDILQFKADLQKDKLRFAHFGRIQSNTNSAFLLAFGNITVVEFSRVGACYIYESEIFKKILPDFWTTNHITEGALKDKNRCIKRIRHINTYTIDWRDDTRRILAMYGIRTGSF